MKQFNALKKVNAKPMTRQEYNDLRELDLPANGNGADDGYITEDIEVESNLDGYHGHVSWSPKEAFEKYYYMVDTQIVGESVKGECTAPADPNHELTADEIKTLASGGSLCNCCELVQVGGDCPIEEGDEFDFGSAIHLLQAGKKVMRQGWNGRAMFLYYVPAASYPMQRNSLETMAGEFEDNLVPYGAYIAMKTAQNNVVPWLASQTDVLATDWCLA